MKQFKRSKTELIWLMFSFLPLPLMLLYELVFGTYFDPWLGDPVKSMVFNITLTLLCLVPVYVFIDSKEIITVEDKGMRFSGGFRKKFIPWSSISSAAVSEGYRRTISIIFIEDNVLKKMSIGFFLDKEDMVIFEEEIKKICGEKIKWSFKKVH